MLIFLFAKATLFYITDIQFIGLNMELNMKKKIVLLMFLMLFTAFAFANKVTAEEYNPNYPQQNYNYQQP